MRWTRIPKYLVALAMLQGVFVAQHCVGASLTVQALSDTKEFTVLYKGKPMMVYSCDAQKYKPYVKALHTIRGDNVLRDSPADHLHHHSLMYGIKVNGVNFWEETSGSGVQRIVEMPTPQIGQDAAGLPRFSLRQRLHWVLPDDAFLPITNSPALLIEQRELQLTVNEASQEVKLLWHSVFEVGTKTNQIVSTGTTYHGLGIRFARELDGVARHFSASGPMKLEGGRQDISQMPWQAVAFDAPNNPATIAVFGHRDNPGGEPRFFSMRTPFAYISATQGLDKLPLTYKAGEKFELRYMIVLYPSIKSAEELAGISGL